MAESLILAARRGEPTLDCQQCGDPVRVLSETEVQQVARDPYAFVVYCTGCQSDGIAADPTLVDGGVIRPEPTRRSLR